MIVTSLLGWGCHLPARRGSSVSRMTMSMVVLVMVGLKLPDRGGPTIIQYNLKGRGNGVACCTVYKYRVSDSDPMTYIT